jgi:hypothetical protein
MSLPIEKFEYSSDALAQAAWAPSVNTSLTLNPTLSFSTAGYLVNDRLIIRAADISYSGAAIKLRFVGHNTTSCVLSGASIGERSGSTGNFASAPTRITFGGNNFGTIPSGGYLTSDIIPFALDETKSYLVHLLYNTSNPTAQKYGALAGGRYYKEDGTDDTLTQDISGRSYSNDSMIVSLCNIYVYPLVDYSEPSVVQEGSYALKINCSTLSLNDTVTKTCSPTWNLSGQNDLKIWVRASRTGTNFKLGIHDSGGTTTESNIAITEADTWELKTIDISAVADADKDAIDSIILTITNADADNTIYLDYLIADNVTFPDAKYVYHGVDRGDGTTGTLHASTISDAAGAGSNLSAGILKDGETVDDVAGTYSPGGTYAEGQAAQLATDQAAVEAAKASIKDDTTILTITGTYDFTDAIAAGYASGEAAQLATDQAAVNAAKASIKDDTTILTITGTYDFTAAIAAGYASGEAAQLAIDQAAVLAKAAYIIDSQTILSQAGLYHEAAASEVQSGVHFGPSSSYTGTYAGGTDFPAPAYVIEGHTTNGEPGTYHETTVAEVKSGTAFGAGSALTGTYSPGGTYAEGQAAQLATDQAAVLAKAAYIIDSQTILGQAGTYKEVAEAYVLDGVTYGANSAKEGTYAPSDSSGDGTVFGDALSDIINSELGEDAVYTPVSGAAKSIRVFIERNTSLQPTGFEGQVFERGTIIEALLADLGGEPDPGATFVVSGETYTVRTIEDNDDYIVRMICS